MKALIAFLSLSLVAMAVDVKACDVQAFGGLCGAQQVVVQQNVGHYGVQQFVAPQRVFVQRQVVVNRGFRNRAVIVNRGFRSNVVVVRNRGFVPFFGFGFGF